ncbi:MAG: 50S ribosomal protein L23, partial [Prevotella sp.]|nr:50S ribosomal protein L23 [Prevotella sp.]
KMYNVSVADVNTVNYHGKRKSRYTKAGLLRAYIQYGSEAAVREAGKLAVEGKEYVVQDGDIMHFRFNV